MNLKAFEFGVRVMFSFNHVTCLTRGIKISPAQDLLFGQASELLCCVRALDIIYTTRVRAKFARACEISRMCVCTFVSMISEITQSQKQLECFAFKSGLYFWRFKNVSKKGEQSSVCTLASSLVYCLSSEKWDLQH